MADDRARVRLDRWLWAARFYKTRSAATDAVQGGKVHVEGAAAKPARPVRVGDEIRITQGARRVTVIVRQLGEKRGPASEAARLYEETPESLAERERQAEMRRLAPPGPERGLGRPSKRDRRRMDRTRGRRR